VRLPIAVPDPASRPFDVVTVGLNSIDLVAVVEHYPASHSKQRLESYSKRPGGQMATAAAVCARPGWRARYIGAFGSDDLAVRGRESLTAEGVDVSAAWDVPGATSQFAVIPTVVDVEKVRDGIHDLLVHIDCILAAQAFPEALTGIGDPGRALAAIAADYHAPLVAVTLGEEGSLALCGGRRFPRQLRRCLPAQPQRGGGRRAHLRERCRRAELPRARRAGRTPDTGGGGRDAAVRPPVVMLNS